MLESALVQSEKWLEQNLKSSFSDLSEIGDLVLFRKLKALCEISFLEFVVCPSDNKEVQEALKPLLRTFITTPRFLRMARAQSAHANLFLPLWLAALYAEPELLQNPVFKQDLKTILRAVSLPTKERIPFRIVDVLHGLYTFTGDPFFMEEMKKVAAHGALGGGLTSPYFINSNDDYAITHTIFYLTDFGRQPWPDSMPSPEHMNEVLLKLEDDAWESGNLDLQGEYAICRSLLGLQGYDLDRQIETLLSSIEPEGYWQGPVDISKKMEQEGMPEDSFQFFENYHTTIVCQLALRCFLGKKRVTPIPLLPSSVITETPKLFVWYHTMSYMPYWLRKMGSGIVDMLNQTEIRVSPSELEDAITSPTRIIFGYDWLWTYRNQRGSLPPLFQEYMRDVDQAELEEKLDNQTFMVIWALSDVMEDGNPEKAWEVYQHFREMVAADLKSNTVSVLRPLSILCLLQGKYHWTETKAELKRWVDYYLRWTMANCHTYEFMAIWMRSAHWYRPSQAQRDGYFEYLLSMRSLNMPLGWMDLRRTSTAGLLEFTYHLLVINLLATGQLDPSQLDLRITGHREKKKKVKKPA